MYGSNASLQRVAKAVSIISCSDCVSRLLREAGCHSVRRDAAVCCREKRCLLPRTFMFLVSFISDCYFLFIFNILSCSFIIFFSASASCLSSFLLSLVFLTVYRAFSVCPSSSFSSSSNLNHILCLSRRTTHEISLFFLNISVRTFGV